jgi:hypothetical protein
MSQKNDIVLIYCDDQPMSFARIEEILPDHKKDWYHVTLLVLQIPLQTITWILRSIYIEGAEFTMNGRRMRLEPVVAPEKDKKTEPQTEVKKNKAKTGGPMVISLADRRKE